MYSLFASDFKDTSVRAEFCTRTDGRTRVHTQRQTDIRKLIFAIRSLTNLPKIPANSHRLFY